MNPARKSTPDSSDIRAHLLHAAERLSYIIDNDNNEPLGEINTLRDDQTNVFNDVGSYLIDLATDPNPASAPMARIILPPRTGKTVIASTVTSASGLLTTFIVPTTTLVFQTAAEFAKKLPYEQIGIFCGERKHLVNKGVNVTTYHMLQHHHTRHGSLPDEIAHSSLVFADEGHHAMTDARQHLLRIGFANEAPRIALTATANYSEERALAKYFPRLLHEITVSEAIDLELLAPVRLWLYEVDIDATHVQLRNGDLDPEQLGSLMSAAPCFEAARVHRYSEDNEKLSALICCSSVNQAKSLKTYLDLRQPKDKPKAALLFGDTTPNQRQLVLDAFEAGIIDTIINVGILIEGWSSPRCKLLIDLSPSLSQVRATQKFFRPMTKDGDAEARIIMIMPQNLRYMPVLPMDVFGTQDEYEPGEEISRFKKKGATKQKPLIKKVREVESVELVSNLRLSCMFKPPQLDKTDRAQIRAVMTSNPEFKAVEIAMQPSLLKRMHFNHPLFSGIGSHLARYISLPLKRNEAFQKAFGKLFPKAVADAILRRDMLLQEELNKWHHYGAELPELQTFPELLIGEYTCAATGQSPEALTEMRDEHEFFTELYQKLLPVQGRLIRMRYVENLTLHDIGDRFGITRETARQRILADLETIRSHLRSHFSDEEWGCYTSQPRTSSMNHASAPVKHYSFADAMDIAREHGWRSKNQYHAGRHSYPGLPPNPDSTYKYQGWISWRNFLGTEKSYVEKTTSAKQIGNMTFQEAMETVRKRGWRTSTEYFAGYKSIPGLPSNPNITYASSGWLNWPSFLGTKRGPRQKTEDILSFGQAMLAAQAQGWRFKSEYKEHYRLVSGLPANPEKIYVGHGWVSWPHFLGTAKA
ncbi:MAG: sigma factor-like helix-turn-helix DNA-binding protein [Patescibacteria group bacterium]